jgi:hypothetical protein
MHFWLVLFVIISCAAFGLFLCLVCLLVLFVLWQWLQFLWLVSQGILHMHHGLAHFFVADRLSISKLNIEFIQFS